MKFLNIVKDGISNVVDEAMYKAVYEPAGWKVISEEFGDEQLAVSPSDEIIKKNTDRMKRATTKTFDDKLIKEKSNGKI